jgi:hypothetical protein
VRAIEVFVEELDLAAVGFEGCATLYTLVWRPGSRVEWGSPVVTATTLEGADRLMKLVRDRIDEDIARRGSPVVETKPKKGRRP